VLVTENYAGLLPTVRSRCQEVAIKPDHQAAQVDATLND